MSIFSNDISVASATAARKLWKSKQVEKPAVFCLLRDGTTGFTHQKIEKPSDELAILDRFDFKKIGSFVSKWVFEDNGARQIYLYDISDGEKIIELREQIREIAKMEAQNDSF